MGSGAGTTAKKMEQMHCNWMLLKILHFIFIRIVCLPMANTMLIFRRNEKAWRMHWTMVKPSLTFKLFETLFCFYGAAQCTCIVQQHMVLFRFVSFCPSWKAHSMTLHQNASLSLFSQKRLNESSFEVWKLHVRGWVCVCVGDNFTTISNEWTDQLQTEQCVCYTHTLPYKRLSSSLLSFARTIDMKNDWMVDGVTGCLPNETI